MDDGLRTLYVDFAAAKDFQYEVEALELLITYSLAPLPPCCGLRQASGQACPNTIPPRAPILTNPVGGRTLEPYYLRYL